MAKRDDGGLFDGPKGALMRALAEAQQSFDTFWAIYPRRVGKLDAQRAFTKALKLASPEEVLAGAERYARHVVGKDLQYVCHGATWLNGGRWMDEYPEPALNGIDAARADLRRRIEDEQRSASQGSLHPGDGQHLLAGSTRH